MLFIRKLISIFTNKKKKAVFLAFFFFFMDYESLFFLWIMNEWSRKSHRKVAEKSQKSHRKVTEKSQKSRRKVTEKVAEIYFKVMYKQGTSSKSCLWIMLGCPSRMGIASICSTVCMDHACWMRVFAQIPTSTFV